jgi:PhnB protein
MSDTPLLLIVEDPAAVRVRGCAGAAEGVPVAVEHGWRLERIVDPLGHHWEIARPLS